MNKMPASKPTETEHATKRSVTTLQALVGAIVSLGMALSVVSLIFFMWLADEVFEGDTTVFDQFVRGYVHGYEAPLLTSAMFVLSFMGSTIFLTAASIIAVIVFLLLKRRRSALIVAAVMIGSSILNYVLKVSFRRPRPIPYFDIPLASFSFPSGHALCSACFYGILAWVITSRIKNLPLQVAIWTAAALMIALIGLSRIYLGVHYPSDVIAGYLAAFVWTTAVIVSDSFFRTRMAAPIK